MMGINCRSSGYRTVRRSVEATMTCVRRWWTSTSVIPGYIEMVAVKIIVKIEK